jgi:hypothetical protein
LRASHSKIVPPVGAADHWFDIYTDTLDRFECVLDGVLDLFMSGDEPGGRVSADFGVSSRVQDTTLGANRIGADVKRS